MTRRILGHGVKQLGSGKVGRLQASQCHVERRHCRRRLRHGPAERFRQSAADGGQILAAGSLRGRRQFLGSPSGQPGLGGQTQRALGKTVLRAAGHHLSIADRLLIITDKDDACLRIPADRSIRKITTFSWAKIPDGGRPWPSSNGPPGTGTPQPTQSTSSARPLSSAVTTRRSTVSSPCSSTLGPKRSTPVQTRSRKRSSASVDSAYHAASS